MRLQSNQGIPRGILLMMAVMSGVTVANLYYNQPLLEMMRHDLGCSVIQANGVTVATQLGYVLGLLFITPMADLYSHRRIVTVCLSAAGVASLMIASAGSIWAVWGASLLLGACSVVAQLFIPIAGQYARPEHKARDIGIVLAGLLSGILLSRVVSGAVALWAGWRSVYLGACGVMLLSIVAMLALLPRMQRNFEGSYGALLRSVLDIFRGHPRIRLNALRAALSMGAMLAVWSCLAFHMAGPPFHAGSHVAGSMGLCGAAGALVAGGVGNLLPRLGLRRFCLIGTVLQMLAWCSGWLWGYSYIGLAVTIIVLDIALQFMQVGNQSASIAEMPEASNRINTIFMTTFFVGGCMGTFLAGWGWHLLGWAGVCLVGFLMAASAFALTCLRWK